MDMYCTGYRELKTTISNCTAASSASADTRNMFHSNPFNVLGFILNKPRERNQDKVRQNFSDEL